ncbi:hypothetical protein LWI28_012301 [Acer negundo]|uniref:Protein kinase domain-containing protein n=1 Tax=Acer negundo TaxID=4023 RepID=A0AAD5P4A2_ACENE|nr:hypothetical protein LWI28_012301 [Acer negundo]
MAIAAVLSSASTTNIRWFLWLFYFLSLFMSQSCLAYHDQFNFNHGRLFSRKLCPGSCSMNFELQPLFRDSTVSESTHLSASSNPRRNGMKNRASKMYLSVSAAALVLIAVSSTWHMRRRDSLFQEEQENIRETEVNRSGNDDISDDNLRRGSENQMVSERRPVFQLDVIRKFKKYFSIETKIRNQVEFQGLPSFPLKVILKATQYFSDDRILGEGSFGVVYMGQLDDGGLIAVKRLSPSSLFAEALVNEVSTLANLQHKNVIKILGYCIKRDEKMLIYELMSNGSLDNFIFDDRITGTYEYMSPEYLIHGQLSVKTDVYSFGVLLLEIITGKKNTSFRSMEHEMTTLLEYVWKLWCEGQALDLIDPALKHSGENYNNEIMRCIHIGLLCIQEDQTDRPTMSSVVVMLASDDVKLPELKSSDIEYISASEGSI